MKLLALILLSIGAAFVSPAVGGRVAQAIGAPDAGHQAEAHACPDAEPYYFAAM